MWQCSLWQFCNISQSGLYDTIQTNVPFQECKTQNTISIKVVPIWNWIVHSCKDILFLTNWTCFCKVKCFNPFIYIIRCKNTNQCQERTFQPIVVSLWMINYWGGRKNSLCMPITLRVFSENQYSCGFLRIVQLWWWKHFEFEVWSHQNPVKLTRKIYLRKNCEPQEKKDEESWKSSADPNNPRDPTVFLRTSRLLLFCQHCFTPLHLFFVQNPSTRHQILWS